MSMALRYALEGQAVLISETSRSSGVSDKALRYYEDIGLLAPPDRTPSGYRDYDRSVLERLSFIRAAQGLGLTLGEIRSIIALREDGQTPCAHVFDLLRIRADEIDTKIKELRALQKGLNRLVARARHLRPEECHREQVCHLIEPRTAEVFDDKGGSAP